MKYYYLVMSILWFALALAVAILNPSNQNINYRILVPVLELNLSVFNYLSYRNICEAESRS